MSKQHWHRHLLWFIGRVVDIHTKDQSFKNVLILDISINERYIFLQKECGNGVRGFLSINELYMEETNLKPAFKVPTPSSQLKEPKTIF